MPHAVVRLEYDKKPWVRQPATSEPPQLCMMCQAGRTKPLALLCWQAGQAGDSSNPIFCCIISLCSCLPCGAADLTAY